MKNLNLFLSLMLVLMLLMAGCAAGEPGDTAPAQEGLPEEPAAEVTEAPAAEEAGGMATAEPQAGVAETPAVEEPAAEVTEAPAAEEAQGLATEEPEAAVAETPAAEVAESAQADEATTDEAEVIPPTGAANLSRLSNLLDFEVWNNNNEQIGTVNAIVINQDTAQIEYIVIGTGGFLGLGENEIPAPWSVLQIQEATAMAEPEADVTEGDETQVAEAPQNVFIVDLTQEQLEQAPEFDLTSLYEPQGVSDEGQATEAMSLSELEQEVHSFWQSDQMPQTGETKNLVLADDLLGATVQNGAAGMSDPPAGDTQTDAAQTDLVAEDLGLVEEIMVDLNTGQMTYLLVSLIAPTPAVQETPAVGVPPTVAVAEPLAIQVAAVPWEALEWNAEEGILIYTGSQSLEQAPMIDLDAILNDQITTDWTSEADSFWGREGSSSESE